MSELFDLPESKSPRLQWIEKHAIECRNYSDGKCYSFTSTDSAWGDTEDEAITQLALKLGIKMWFEEGLEGPV